MRNRKSNPMTAAEGSLLTLGVVFVALPLALLALGVLGATAVATSDGNLLGATTPGSASGTTPLNGLMMRRRRKRAMGALWDDRPPLIGPGEDGCGQIWDVYGNPIWTNGITGADYAEGYPRTNPYGG